ncbi:hypothetical protein BS50DRAFT_532444 [Corynespora cassiicola Philippines]|uniref:Centromere protein Cenp-K n=1 Tax=Corynespora cassiicola Philippines TaxID=1448308 RepID=A0A2T2NBK4_CORCC|nr:hypothetical protein BS50DRAFT_532444 [Corynespora cassiicola Philippines]
MGPPPDEALANIRRHVADARSVQDAHMDFDATGTEARLEQTVKELQARVRDQQEALERLRSSSRASIHDAAYASADPRERLQQLIAVKDAYLKLTPTPLLLPAKGSVLPALLAARTLQQNVQGTKEAISSTQEQIDDKEALLRREEASLHNAHLLTQAMESRIEALQSQHEDRSQKTPAQLAKELVAAKRLQKEAYDADMQRLGEAMNDFINDHLSAMLAAEELGGPVVGDLLDVGDDTLAAGFTKKGKIKSTKKPASDKTRQRRIDQIWGVKAAAQDEEEPLTEAEAADNDMRKLIENLFATLTGPGGGKAYYELERESAASRFLIRAKVAQFHPKDARKLRLIDFGRELDD